MIRVIKYFFYKIYSFSLSNGETDAGWAMAIVSIFGIFNIYGILGIIQILLQLKTPQVDKWVIIFLALTLLYLYYTLLIKNDKSKEIVKEFKEMEGSRAMLNLLLALYIIGSVILFIYTANVVRALNK
jgi:hypothetical protein